MKIVFLGTGSTSGTPKIGCNCENCRLAREFGGIYSRSRFSILIDDGKKILVDTSPDLRAQFLKANLSGVDLVLITHTHYDHFTGLGELHGRLVDFWALPDTLDYVLKWFDYLRKESRIQVKVIETYQQYEYGKYKIQAFNVMHEGAPTTPVGYIIQDDSHKIVITGDTGSELPQKSLETMKNPDLLISEGTFFKESIPKIHLNVDGAIKLGGLLGAKETILTHFSHRNKPYNELNKYVQQFGNFLASYDQMTIEL
ncbi:MAG: MBL fold metallo-hydrolase [Euryarchaeota archaeon]|nr:MBL fold metallo-hydrolase [Euryarchaeota archaeon]